MQDLLKSLEKLQNTEIANIIDSRINEFENFQSASIDEIFKEMCFCIMTANCGADKCIEVHEKIGNEFLYLSSEELTSKFREYGYRYPNVRSQYILEARTCKEALAEKLNSCIEPNELRDWIVKNIKGLGYKESSHFLRNIGWKDYAIVDFHIIDILVSNGIIEKPKTLTKNKYLEIEKKLQQIGRALDLNMAQLDLYLWYLETGKVLK